MKVLWFSCTPSCFDVKVNGGWVEALERAIRKYRPDIELGIVFEHEDQSFKVVKDDVTYYPINLGETKFDSWSNRIFPSAKKKLETLTPTYLNIINDFKPDIIQCFGMELWHYSLLNKIVDIPFVVHIMGFWHSMNMANKIVAGKYAKSPFNILRGIKSIINNKHSDEHQYLEAETLSSCKYFLGRTKWDESIVKYHSCGAKYYYCSEAIRDNIYLAANQWKYKADEVIRLVTVSNAGRLKGNEMVLHTAWILKNIFHKKVEWIYTSNTKSMEIYEKVTGISCKDVGINLIGRISSADLVDTLCSSQIFIHPSMIDNSPNAVCEAQLIGIPGIATNVGGIPQIVEDNVTGLLYPYNEPYTLAYKILELHNNQEKLELLSANALRVSIERHSPMRIVNRLFEIYEDIIIDYQKYIS